MNLKKSCKRNDIRPKKTQKPTGVLKDVVQEDQKGCKKSNISYVLKRNRQLLHGRNKTKTRRKIPA